MAAEYSNSGNSDQIKYFLGGALFGAVIGGAFALLYAPMKGEETRKVLRERAIQAEQLAVEKANQARVMAGEMAADVRDRAAAVKKRGEEILECVKEQGA